jgi:nucleotide-binding universal stress UspA family protein
LRGVDELLGGVKRILVPLDLNRLGEGKIPNSEAYARAFGAELILLHVLPTAPPSTGRVTMAESQALTYLYAIAARLRSEGVTAHTLVRYGPVAEVILAEIAQQQADLVILGPNVRRNIPALLGASIADTVIARSTCPVLLVPAPATERLKTPVVRAFDEDVARTGAVAPHDLGVRTVAISRIVGSVGRAAELDVHFRVRNPSRGEQRRYERIRDLMEQGAPLPPISLYKLGYGYYVLDGNHRIAAAKELGQLEIEAEVTEFLPLEDPQAQRVFLERRRFEQDTGLKRVGAAQPGSYPTLLALIHEYARENGLEDVKEAAPLWDARVYRPVARLVRQLRLGHYFPDMRTADVFIQISEFREQELERTGEKLTWEAAVERFQATHTVTLA